MIKFKKSIGNLLRIDQEDSQGGWTLISVMVMSLLLTSVGISLTGLVASQYQHTSVSEYQQNASLVAEAGVEQSVNALNANSNFTGYPSAQQFFNNSTQGLGTFTTSITTNADGTSKTIVSIGKVYHLSNTTTPYLTREIKVTVVGTTSAGNGVAAGPGGLILGGSAIITNANVYVGGTLTMTGASKIGTAATPITLNDANDACPKGSNPGSTFPQVCSGSSQPISLAQSTDIYGTVCATGQTSTGPNNNIQGGVGGSGLEAGCTAPVTATPTYNRSAQISAVTTDASGSSNTYVCNSYPFNRNWPANLELTGNVNLASSCNVTINGDVYITGNLNIGGASSIITSNSVGTNRPVVIVDGTITVGGSAAFLSNSSLTGIEFISFQSTAACNPNCTSVTGTDLYNSMNTTTVSLGGSVSTPGMIFDAYWGQIVVGGSVNVGQIIGQTVNLSGAGTLIVGTNLTSGSETWSITSYQLLYPS